MAKLGLGCAALGMAYGVQKELMPEADAVELIKAAYDSGIRFFDTARAYGQSEERLKKAGLPKDVIICTKMNRTWPTIEANIILAHKVINSVQLSGLGRRVSQIAEFGASIYTRTQAELALECRYVKWLEVPINLVDRRFLAEEFLAKCRAKGTKLIGRSIFLQGVLAEGPLPVVAKRDKLVKLRNYARSSAVDCMDFVFGNLADVFEIALIGPRTLDELAESVSMANSATIHLDLSCFDNAKRYSEEYKLFDPRNWNQ